MKKKTLLEILAEDDGSINNLLITIKLLIDDLQQGKTEDWENLTLESFLEAMHAWLETMGPRINGKPSWKFIEHMILAAKIYE
ncbi:MAG: hypothetical protein V4660_09810 [Pseudomonadota bacterium]